MSILPSHSNNHTASSSYSLSSTNPNSNHGSNQQEQQPSRPSPSGDSPEIPSDNNFSGNMAPAASHGSGGSSEKVNNSSGSQDGLRSSGHHYGGRVSPQELGKSARSNDPTGRRDHFGSNSPQGNATRSAPRRNQMVSGNHLLNFHYDPISRPQSRAPPPPKRYHKRKPYNKDLFLQANYKFVLLDSGNYTPETMDPDKMLQWEDIVCLRYSTPFHVQCPICLEDPLCPQITSCGHIFCFPCVMQYFMISEDDHKDDFKKKCPLCFMMISSKDLYTIQIENVKQHHVGDVIDFVLLTRHKDSFTLSLKNNDGSGGTEEVQKSFSKFAFTSDVDLSVREAMSDLDSWLAKADSGLVDDLQKLPYVCAAMEQLEQRKKYWNAQHIAVENSKSNRDNSLDRSAYGPQESAEAHSPRQSTPEMPSSRPAEKPILQVKSTLNKVVKDSQLIQAAEVESIEDCVGSSLSLYDNNKSLQKDSSGFTDREEINSYSFYQAVDGQHLILHPLNMKCLLHYYGGYDSLPSRISGKILQMESVTQSEAMRRRYRFLSHFSLTTTFQLCEIDLSKMLPMDALSPFMGEIKRREKQRKWQDRKERREKVNADAIGMHLEPVPYSFAESSYMGEPSFTSDDFEALGGTSATVTSSSPPVPGGRQLFSNVARLGFAAGCDPPALRTDESAPKVDVARDSSVAAGTRSSGTPLSFANVTSKAKVVEGPNVSKKNDAAKKGKKPNRILMSTAGGRRY